MCTICKYEESFNWNHPLVKELMTWIGQVFIEKELQHYFLKFAASCLKARNSDKIFAIWTGSGDNSKSMIVKLFNALGPYAIKFPVCMLTENERSSGSATPQFARAKATRIAFLDEPEDHISINKGTIKRFTGGDSFFARFLHSNGGEIEATFKMVLMCNKIPVIANPDTAVKNRTRILPFLSKWVSDPPATIEEQYRQRLFKVDRSFEHRIMGLAPAFLWVMTQYYPYYIEEGLTVPQMVIDSTNSYWKDNDIYAQFAASVVEPVMTPEGEADINCSITLTALHNEFKEWFKSACPGRTIPDRTTICAEFSSRWGRMQNGRWYGFRIIREQDDLNSLLSGRRLIKPSSTAPRSPAPVEPVSFIRPPTPVASPGPIPGPK
jgi:phage/plasmid-associated DNA primase